MNPFIIAPILMFSVLMAGGYAYKQTDSWKNSATEVEQTEQVSTPAPIEQPKTEIKNDTEKKVISKPVVSQPVAEAPKKKKKGGTKKHDDGLYSDTYVSSYTYTPTKTPTNQFTKIPTPTKVISPQFHAEMKPSNIPPSICSSSTAKNLSMCKFPQ